MLRFFPKNVQIFYLEIFKKFTVSESKIFWKNIYFEYFLGISKKLSKNIFFDFFFEKRGQGWGHKFSRDKISRFLRGFNFAILRNQVFP